MDNDAFRAIINKQRKSVAPEKSTKEIAREAVENEFQNKRRRGGGGGRRGRGDYDADGYGSDSGGSSDEGVNGAGRQSAKDEGGDAQPDDVPEWKRRRRERRRQDGGGAGASEYRDRAKERREGNNLDYASLEGLAQSGEGDRRRQAELSKYLGGDEEHTHLVKGLDKALAEKVRREEMGQGDSKELGDLDQILDDAYADRKNQSRKEISVDWRALKPKTELGKSVLAYLLEKRRNESSATQSAVSVTNLLAYSQHKSNSAVKKSIRRSILTFSLNSDVRRRNMAWEVPRMSVQAFGAQDGDNAAAESLMNPLNLHMIATISKKLDEGVRRKKERSHNYHDTHADVSTEDRNGSINDSQDKEGRHEDIVKPSACADDGKNSSNDSDDDIFDNVGSYVPREMESKSSAAASRTDPNTESAKQGSETDNNAKVDKETEEEKPKQGKKSIFDNLLPAAVSAPPVQIHQTKQNHPFCARQNRQQRSQRRKNLINRDILGGKRNGVSEAHRKRWGPRSAAAEGVSMATYDGGYGEEMDADFGGDEDRRGKADDKEDEAASATADAGDDEED